MYKGSFFEDNFNGYGELHSKDGTIYKGKFVNNAREGKGEITSNLYEYEGYFKNDKMEGSGKIIYKRSKESYEG